MQTAKKQILPVLVSAMAIVALAMAPALAKDSKNKKSRHSSAKAAAEAAGHVPEQSDAPQAVPRTPSRARSGKPLVEP